MSYLYRKTYEGIKTNCFTLFGNLLQSHQLEKDTLSEKLAICQEALARCQADQARKGQEMEARERHLRQHIVQQEFKAR